MKQPKRLTRAQKIFLSKRGINPNIHMLVVNRADALVIINNDTGEVEEVAK